MRNRTLDVINYSITLATALRLAVFAIVVWAAVEVDTTVLRLLLSAIAAVQIVMTVRRVILVRRILKHLDTLDR